jgi:hypothetical protein
MKINDTVGMTIFIVLLVVSIIMYFLMLSIKEEKLKKEPDYEKIKDYLVNDSSLAKSDKPILWLHNTYEINDRNWASFYSRNTNELNKPIVYITVDNLIKKCGKSFRVALIDDNSFNNLIPGWVTVMDQVSEPMREYYRYIGMLNLLYLYGGMTIPSSFLCFKNMNKLYEKGLEGNDVFVGESLSKSNEYSVYVNNNIIGASKNSNELQKIILDLERILLEDQTNEPKFKDTINKYLEGKVSNGDINLIEGKHLGLFDEKGDVIRMEDLVKNTDMNVHDESYGLNVPIDEIIKSVKYDWFSKLGLDEIISSNTLIAKYLNIYYCN